MIFHRYLPSRSIILPYVFHTMDGPERSWVRPGTPSTHMGRATGWCSQSAPWQTGWVGWCWMFFASPKTIEKKYPILKNKIKILFYNCGKLLFHLFGDYILCVKSPWIRAFFMVVLPQVRQPQLAKRGDICGDPRCLRKGAWIESRGLGHGRDLATWLWKSSEIPKDWLVYW